MRVVSQEVLYSGSCLSLAARQRKGQVGLGLRVQDCKLERFLAPNTPTCGYVLGHPKPQPSY